MGELREFAAVSLKLLNFLEPRERGLVAFYVVGVVFEILEFAGRVVGLEAFEELLGLDEQRGKLFNLRVGEQVLPPKWDAAGKLLVGADKFFDALVDDLVKLLNGLSAALGDHHGLAGRQIHQLE